MIHFCAEEAAMIVGVAGSLKLAVWRARVWLAARRRPACPCGDAHGTDAPSPPDGTPERS